MDLFPNASMSDKADKVLNAELAEESSVDQQLIAAKDEQENLKKLVQAADGEKSRLFLEKLDSDNAKKEAQQEIKHLMDAEEQLGDTFKKTMQGIQMEVKDATKANEDLKKKLQHFKNLLKSKEAEMDSLRQRFKIKAQIPEKKMKFTSIMQKQECESDEQEYGEDIKGVFTIIQRPFYVLKGGEALITFEEEKVADQILKLPKCTVTCDKTRSEVKPSTITLEPSAKFEVHIMVSKRTIEFSNATAYLSEERMRDRLELGFSKPSQGGGEVERIEYEAKIGAGRVTFLNTGVAENLALQGNFFINAGKGMEVSVAPLYEYQLKKFQTFLGVPKRTVLLRGIHDANDEEDMQDHLEIHFQKPSNYGGEVESIRYVSHGKELTALFSEDSADVEAA